MTAEQVCTGRRDARAHPLRTDEDLLHRDHQDLIRASCFKALGKKNGRLLDDAVQDTNYKALCSLRKGSQVRAPRAWLATLARNASLNVLRADNKHRPSAHTFEGTDGRDIDEEASDHGWFSDCIRESAEIEELFFELDHRMTPRQIEVFALALDGHSQKDIAKLLGVSPPLINNEIQRIRTLLLDPDPDGDGNGGGNGRRKLNKQREPRRPIFSIANRVRGGPMSILRITTDLSLAEQFKLRILQLPAFRECRREISAEFSQAVKRQVYLPAPISLSCPDEHCGRRIRCTCTSLEEIYESKGPADLLVYSRIYAGTEGAALAVWDKSEGDRLRLQAWPVALLN